MRCLVIASVALALALSTEATASAQEEPLAAGSFDPTGSLSQTRAWHSAILAPDGRVFVVGGEDMVGPEVSRLTVEAWDPETGSFALAGSHDWSHGWRPALPLPDGRILVLGGNVLGYPASAEIWDPETGSSSFAGTVEGAHAAGSRTVLPDGRVLVTGGYGDLGSGLEYGPVDTVGIWNPTSGVYTPLDPLPEARADHTATLLDDGRVLIVGGWSLNERYDTALLWDPATGSFHPAGSLADGERFSHTATLLDDGHVLIIGGSGLEGQLASAEVWDPATASFSPAGSLAEGRGGQPMHTATLLHDGRVLVVGGAGQHGPLADTEIWDPVTASFSPAGSPAQARGDHTSTLLPDGRVLVVGGRGVEDEFLASAELWIPAEDGPGAGGIADSSPDP